MATRPDTAELRAADAFCRALLRHDENFTVASRLSPRALRRDLARVYAFCRTTDDLGDESGPPRVALERLQRWRGEVEAMVAGAAPLHPVLLALADTMRRHEMASQPFLDLVDANLQDQSVHRYEDWDALRGYCMLSAAPVGRMVLQLNGITGERATALSDDVCIGLQLANFAQDVARDAEHGRVYLLQQDLREHGPDGAVRAMCARAADLLGSGRELEAMVAPRLRLQLAMYRLGGEAILRAIARRGYRTATGRPVLTTGARARVLAGALAVRRG